MIFLNSNPRSVLQKSLLLIISIWFSGAVSAAENILIHDKIPAGVLAESPLAGKVIRYEYHTGVLVTANDDAEVDLISVGETVDVSFDQGSCTWIGLQGKFVGETATQACGQTEVAPNIYFVTWLESNGEAVSMTINLNTWKLNSSYTHNGSLEYLQATIHSFGRQ